jgi:hypothetical protein
MNGTVLQVHRIRKGRGSAPVLLEESPHDSS